MGFGQGEYHRFQRFLFLAQVLGFFGSFQTVGSSSSSFTCSSFSDFLSKSKIPPKFGFARGQIGEQGGEALMRSASMFSSFLRLKSNPDYTLGRPCSCQLSPCFTPYGAGVGDGIKCKPGVQA
jgi:hypothetical protein